MTPFKTALLAALLPALVAVSGCASSDPKGTHAGYPNGFETEARMAVQLRNAPKADDATFLTSVDAEIQKRLESDRESMLDAAIAAYEKERGEDGTKITRENCEVLYEDFAVQEEDTAATRKLFEGKVCKFRFTLRKPKARIVPDPTRVEAVVFCVERSWAPGDTLRFPQIFRAEIIDRLNMAIFDVAQKQGLDPVKPRRMRTE